MIRSKFSGLVYLTILLHGVFIAFGVYLLANPAMQFSSRFSDIDGVTLPGLVLVGVFGSLLLRFLRKAFVLKIDNDQLDLLTLGGRYILYRTDIQYIDLRGRETVYGQAADVVTIITVYGKTHVLPDRLCSNMAAIKQILTGWYGDLVINRITVEPGSRPTYTGETEVFRGKPFLNFHGLAFLTVLAVLIWWCVEVFAGQTDWRFPWGLLPWLLLAFVARMFGGELCYFVLRSDELEIRNHVFPWYKKVHELEDISDVVFAFASKRAYSLHIRTTGQRSHSYGAGSLRGAHWKALEKAFRKRRIMVHNELPGI